MNYKNYQEESKRTCPNLSDNLREGLSDELHMVMGISTEAGELLDAYKKHFAYGKELDVVNVGEEIADIMDCPIGTVRSRIFRAREAISEKLKPLLEKTDKRW